MSIMGHNWCSQEMPWQQQEANRSYGKCANHARHVDEFKAVQGPARQRIWTSSLTAAFNPIRGMFRFAANEELIDYNPMRSVYLQGNKRRIHEKMWTPSKSVKMQRLLTSMNEFWGSPMRGLSDERRVAVHMGCRVVAFSCLLPMPANPGVPPSFCLV
jgi:hypothetical protein